MFSYRTLFIPIQNLLLCHYIYVTLARQSPSTSINMTSLPPLLLLLLLLSVSLHACTPRPLTSNYHFHKGLNKIKLLTASRPRARVNQAQLQKLKVVNNEIKVCESCSSSASTLKEMIVGAASGTSFQTDSPSFLAAKDERRHGRSMLGPDVDVEETSTSTAEDIIEMDYAQPHRKPPIHNEKP